MKKLLGREGKEGTGRGWVALRLKCMCEPEARKVGGRSLVLCRLGRIWQNSQGILDSKSVFREYHMYQRAACLCITEGSVPTWETLRGSGHSAQAAMDLRAQQPLVSQVPHSWNTEKHIQMTTVDSGIYIQIYSQSQHVQFKFNLLALLTASCLSA